MKKYVAKGLNSHRVYAMGSYIAVRRFLYENYPSIGKYKRNHIFEEPLIIERLTTRKEIPEWQGI